MISILNRILNILKKKKSKTLNEFLNIKDIPKGKHHLLTLDGQMVLFIKVCPINVELLSEEEKRSKMDYMSLEFANEQYPYKILVIPRKVDISEHIYEQQELKSKIADEISNKIIERRIVFANDLVSNKDIIENEFYVMIWMQNSDNAEIELNKRANNWITRFRNCEFHSEMLEEREIIFLLKSFTIPEFAREGTDYGDNIVQIKRKEYNC